MSEPWMCSKCGNLTENPRHECGEAAKHPPMTHEFNRGDSADDRCSCGFPRIHHFHGYDAACKCWMCADQVLIPSPLLTRIARFIPRIRGL